MKDEDMERRMALPPAAGVVLAFSHGLFANKNNAHFLLG